MRTYTRPVLSTNACVANTTTIPTAELTHDMVNALTECSDWIKTVPYFEMKFWPVSWRKMLTPTEMRVRLRLAVY